MRDQLEAEVKTVADFATSRLTLAALVLRLGRLGRRASPLRPTCPPWLAPPHWTNTSLMCVALADRG